MEYKTDGGKAWEMANLQFRSVSQSRWSVQEMLAHLKTYIVLEILEHVQQEKLKTARNLLDLLDLKAQPLKSVGVPLPQIYGLIGPPKLEKRQKSRFIHQ